MANAKKLNRNWHQEHQLGSSATLDDRIRWHLWPGPRDVIHVAWIPEFDPRR